MRMTACITRRTAAGLAGALALAFGVAATPATAQYLGACSHDLELESDPALRAAAARQVKWVRPGSGSSTAERVALQLLGINDFHGQLSAGRRVANRPVGSAGVLASYLKAETAAFQGTTLIVHAGDHVGATPPASALLQDEPAISFLNLLANESCRIEYRTALLPGRSGHLHPDCNMVGTFGNHEFDEGFAEAVRLVEGGNHPNGPYLESPWGGALLPYVSANVVNEETGQPVLPPFVVKNVGGVPVAFIGAVLEATPTIVTPTGVKGLKFLDEADAINGYVQQLKRLGIRAIVVLIHEGGTQTSFNGPTPPAPATVNGPIVDIVARLDGEVDVVISGHAHSFTNVLLPNASGQPTLVTQAFSSSTAYDDVELTIDRATGDVIEKSAVIRTTWADEGPGLTPDPAAAALTKLAEDTVAPLVNRVVGETSGAILRAENAAGESAMGNLIADAQRGAMGTDFAFMNPGGIRADLDAGPATWGELFTIQPFGNSLVKLDLTGEQIVRLLEQQWKGQPFPRILKPSGLTYTWNASLPAGQRIVEVLQNGQPIDLQRIYTVTVNSFLAAGGDNFTVLTEGKNQVGGPIDLDALIAYIQALEQPFSAAIEGRIERLN
ncbi:MAG: bifunctional metallophosphatase/5'-nucleotidase [Acidobacteria bacterium]|nr:bifunctional metallophosphatase/5'-nucleotidase [Acidobacteriota bacterium]